MPAATSHIRAMDIPIIDEVFGMGSGYVLDFTNYTFSEFFVDLGVDIYDTIWAANGDSKAKRLRTYLRQASRQRALETLQALWDYREASGPVAAYPPIREEARAEFFRIIQRLGGTPPAEGTPNVAHDLRRPDAAEAKELAERSLSA